MKKITHVEIGGNHRLEFELKETNVRKNNTDNTSTPCVISFNRIKKKGEKIKRLSTDENISPFQLKFMFNAQRLDIVIWPVNSNTISLKQCLISGYTNIDWEIVIIRKQYDEVLFVFGIATL